MMLTRTTQLFRAIAALLFILSVVVFGTMLYLIETKEARLVAELQRRAEHSATDRQLAALQERLAETADDRALLAEYMLTEDTVVELLSLIETLAAEQGVAAETRALSVVPIEGDDTFEYLTLEVRVTGSFASVEHMLALYAALPYQVKVREAAITRVDEGARAGLWEGAFALFVTKYRQS